MSRVCMDKREIDKGGSGAFPATARPTTAVGVRTVRPEAQVGSWTRSRNKGEGEGGGPV